jgi:hypothetical protein
MEGMSKNDDKSQSPAQIARAEKQRVARVEGAKAMAEADKDHIAIRKNMERLRALRLAKEAEEALNPPVVVPKAKGVRSRGKAPQQKLSEFLSTQKDSGHGS